MPGGGGHFELRSPSGGRGRGRAVAGGLQAAGGEPARHDGHVVMEELDRFLNELKL